MAPLTLHLLEVNGRRKQKLCEFCLRKEGGIKRRKRKKNIYKFISREEDSITSHIMFVPPALMQFQVAAGSLFALAQGVTRDRVNLTNMMLLQLPIPPISEQKAIAHTIGSIDFSLDELERKLAKIKSLKNGLMQDLLTGRKRVTALMKDTEAPTS
ncbi:MAG: restriction endonuclease subunit S [Planctomycetota bacterium]